MSDLRAGHPTRTFHFEPHGEPFISADGGRLRQVVSNLLGNAVQHGSTSEPISLSIAVEGGIVQIAVRNEGSPIPAARLATMFDPLISGTSADAQQPRRAGSIGLGLYIVREIVTAHRGRVDVKSSASDGTVFTVELPTGSRVAD